MSPRTQQGLKTLLFFNFWTLLFGLDLDVRLTLLPLAVLLNPLQHPRRLAVRDRQPTETLHVSVAARGQLPSINYDIHCTVLPLPVE